MPPGVAGVDHPSAAFSFPSSETTDEYGNLYVVSRGEKGAGGKGHGTDARIDIFDSDGHFLSELADAGAAAVAVDSAGHLYVYNERGTDLDPRVLRYDPTLYNPAAGEISYGAAPVVVLDEGAGIFTRNSIAVDGEGHLYVTVGAAKVNEYGSAAEGNAFITTIGEGVLNNSVWIAIDRSKGELYASDTAGSNRTELSVIRVFDLADPAHPLLRTIDGSTTPGGAFSTNAGLTSVAVDESTHHVFVDDRQASTAAKPVYEFTEAGAYVAKVEHKFEYVLGSQIAVDNGAHSPNSAFAPGRSTAYLFVPSGPSAHGHLYAFAPLSVCPPQVTVEPPSGITTSEAVLRAKVNPCGDPTHYTLQYTTEQSFEEEGFAEAITAGEGDLPLGKEAVKVSGPASSLAPGTAYRFRVVASNGLGSGEEEGSFATYPEAIPALGPCPNEALRSGLAKNLSDCRAYELVSPPDTNGHPPLSPDSAIATETMFGISPASPDGQSASFLTMGGAIPGLGGAGSAQGDGYVARRGEGGWQSSSDGPSGEQASEPLSIGLSSDQDYAAWKASGVGSLAVPSGATYIRYLDGGFRAVGRGSIAEDPFATPLLITPGATHIVFGSGLANGRPAIQLEPDAPPSGTAAIYDRTPDEQTHVVSLVPGEVTPGAGENATFKGASGEGRGVVFEIGGSLYERLEDAETLKVASGATYAGISEGGTRVLYLKGGDLFAFDQGTTTQLTTTGDAIPVNVSADGSHAYFLSPSVINSGEENAAGEEAQPGGENLYVSSAGAMTYIATVTERDVVGESKSGVKKDGLGLWVVALEVPRQLAIDPSRTTADGAVFVFASRANLTDYEAEGKAEIYRYAADSGGLSCLSCLPTRLAPTGDSDLQSVSFPTESTGLSPTGLFALIPNVSPDGERVFFQSPDPLVPADANGLQDVYQWEAGGKGSCSKPGGCVSLISSGQGARPSYIYGASTSGDDVFFSTSQQLLGVDSEETPSIYDARVNGGFAEPQSVPCQGEGCRPQPSPPPPAQTPASTAAGPSGNAKKHKKHKHKKLHHKHKHRHHRRASR
jgi:hypothetical protein